ncbi:4-(cytidine 5'-diphospho)-2-C-methyl-D-erythritol kinase [Hahella sp. SMD15-11]|uniref:4-diphosphocytidyl-2-C-methyl-D-erythritol kinase n=1 Tax=Thermohahella caldifontis TaxID=3142973 RepID=A0AB39UX03_9GAMM
MATELSLPAPAKLNLLLHINGRRPDGYHELQTLFQLLDHGDTLHVRRLDTQDIILESDWHEVPPEDNLIVRAARLLQHHAGCRLGAAIRLEKRLPSGGGVGGGSSDAASTLLALDALWQLDLPPNSLARLGRQLGADVPVFVLGRSAWAEGVGERLTPVILPQWWYVVIKPPVHVSTAKIFSHPLLTRDTPKMKIAPAFEGHTAGRNDCENVVFSLYPEVRKAYEWLSERGNARLTGTGACVFARYENAEDAQRVLMELPKHLSGFIAQGVNRSPAHQMLDNWKATNRALPT